VIHTRTPRSLIEVNSFVLFLPILKFAMSPNPHQPTDRLNDPEVLLFEHSPFRNLDAIVQHDGKTVYFYLSEPQSEASQSEASQPQRIPVFGTRACWVRNLDKGPMVLDQTQMQQGISPMLPRTECVHREAQPIPDPDRLQIVWFEEGNGAALIETSNVPNATPKTLAVIPPWSGLEGFHGYSAECVVENQICWPMPDNPNLHQRIQRAETFWSQWNSDNNPFNDLQPKILAAYDERFLTTPNDDSNRQYFAIDGGAFPPRGLAQYTYQPASHDPANPNQAEVILATVGMSICPQPAVEIFNDDPSAHRRIELAIRVPADRFNQGDDFSIELLSQRLSGLASYPWNKFTWLGPGHTCGLLGAEPGCHAVLLVHDHQLSRPRASQTDNADPQPVAMPSFREDPINLLWLIPITPEQQQQLESDKITVEQILTS
jgi:hypothetical protein